MSATGITLSTPSRTVTKRIPANMDHASMVRPGIGFYSRAEASRLLGVTRHRLKRWVDGYTYSARTAGRPKRRRRPGLIVSDLPMIGGAMALSFVELIELRVIKILIDREFSLQAVRRIADMAREDYGVRHPFASLHLFTEGRKILVEQEGRRAEPSFVELTRRGRFQLQAGELVSGFLDEIAFDKGTSLVYRWWPLGDSFPVVLDPRICFGAPTIEGTALRTDVVRDMVGASSPEGAAEAYRIDTSSVGAAVEFEAQLAA